MLDRFQCWNFVGAEQLRQSQMQKYTHAGRSTVQDTEFEGIQVGSRWA